MLVKCGSYVGTGVAHGITGVGFQPDVVFIKSGANWLLARTSTMPTDSVKLPGYISSDVYTGYLTSLDADGFSVGTIADSNANGVTHHYLALKADAADLKVGTYTGDGANGHAITGVGFQPNAVITLPANTRPVYCRTSDMSATNSMFLGPSGVLVTGRIKSLDAGGFTVDSDADANQSTIVYHYIALKTAAGVFEPLTYTGNGSDNRNISTASFQPNFALVKGDTATATTQAAARFKAETGDNAFLIDQTNEAADRIQSFLSNGIQVGTLAAVNENTKSFYGLLFKEAAAGGGGATARKGLLLTGVGT